MSPQPRPAADDEVARIWPAVRSANIFEDFEEFAAFRASAPWRVRVAQGGEASVLEPWREHLDVLAIRGVWAAGRHVPAFVDDARAVARAHGFGRVLSPLLPIVLLRPYERANMRVIERIVAIQGHPSTMQLDDAPPGVILRRALEQDLEAVLGVDSVAFGEFWRYGAPELREYFEKERLQIAEENGQVVGYTLSSVSSGSATLGRLAVVPLARRRGIGAALLSDAARFALRSGANTIALCTQEDNATSRRLYVRAGLSELSERYAFAIGDAEQ